MLIPIFIAAGLVIITGLYLLFGSGNTRTRYTNVQSFVDKNSYPVLDYEDKQKAADQLAHICQDLSRFISSLRTSNPDHLGVKLLAERYKCSTMKEGYYYLGETTYTVNKGEAISLCMRDEQGNLHPHNVLVFVMLHELAHLMTKHYDNSHGAEFQKDFNFLKKEAASNGIYTQISVPMQYCQIHITSA